MHLVCSLHRSIFSSKHLSRRQTLESLQTFENRAKLPNGENEMPEATEPSPRQAPAASRAHAPPPWYPAWVDKLDVPLWVTSPDGIVSYLNSRAESLIHRSARACLGLPCHLIFRGTSPDGDPLCSWQCRVRAAARRGKDIEPFEVCVAIKGDHRVETRAFVIPTYSPSGEGPFLIHCVVDGVRTRTG
jgi:PAS domain-containing protein